MPRVESVWVEGREESATGGQSFEFRFCEFCSLLSQEREENLLLCRRLLERRPQVSEDKE